MPDVKCSVCGQRYRIPTKKWKLILLEEPYVCSKECILKWIRGGMTCTDPPWSWWDRVRYTPFRSDFERRFAKFLSNSGLRFVYEQSSFPVGKGVYIPDFYVLTHHRYLETKGLWQIGQKKKFREFRLQYPDISILVIPWLLQEQFK